MISVIVQDRSAWQTEGIKFAHDFTHSSRSFLHRDVWIPYPMDSILIHSSEDYFDSDSSSSGEEGETESKGNYQLSVVAQHD